MLKTSLPTFIGLALASAAFNSSAAVPPKYLAIADFKQCLATQKINTYSAWCMPAKKFENCPTTSWEQLQALSGSDKLPDCLSGSSLTTPSPEDKPADKYAVRKMPNKLSSSRMRRSSSLVFLDSRLRGNDEF